MRDFGGIEDHRWDPIDPDFYPRGELPHFGAIKFDPILVERLNRSIRASELWYDFMQSQNYVAGTAGFKIGFDGTVEFASGVTLGPGTVTIATDLYSSNWDGANPANLATADGTASDGYYFDYSAGSAQFEGDLYLGGDIELQGTLHIVEGYDNNDTEISMVAGPSSASIRFHDDEGNDLYGLFWDPIAELLQIKPSPTSSTKADFRVSTNEGGEIDLRAGKTGTGTQSYVTMLGGTTSQRSTLTFAADDLRMSLVDYIDLQDGAAFRSGVGGSEVLRVNDDGIAYENANTMLPNRVSVSPTDVTSFANTNWITTPTSTITLWTHGGTNRDVEVMAWSTAIWNESGAVSYTAEYKIQVSVDGGSTWTDSVASIIYMGTGTGAVGYRGQVAVQFHSEFAAASVTGDIQVRTQHKVGNTGMDALRRQHLMAVVEQIF